MRLMQYRDVIKEQLVRRIDEQAEIIQDKNVHITELYSQIEAESDVQYAQRSEIEAKDEQIAALVTAISDVLAQLKFAHRDKCEKATIKDVKALRLACTDVLAAIKEATA